MSDPAALPEHLQFTVEAHLNGEAAQIKEYVLGREVFDRLRQRLAEYYAGPGRADKLRIEFPKGTYAPTISTPQPKRIPIRLILTLTVIAIAAAAFFFTRQTVPADEALAEAVTVHVAKSGKIPIIGWPSIPAFRTNPKLANSPSPSARPAHSPASLFPRRPGSECASLHPRSRTDDFQSSAPEGKCGLWRGGSSPALQGHGCDAQKISAAASPRFGGRNFQAQGAIRGGLASHRELG